MPTSEHYQDTYFWNTITGETTWVRPSPGRESTPCSADGQQQDSGVGSAVVPSSSSSSSTEEEATTQRGEAVVTRSGGADSGSRSDDRDVYQLIELIGAHVLQLSRRFEEHEGVTGAQLRSEGMGLIPMVQPPEGEAAERFRRVCEIAGSGVAAFQQPRSAQAVLEGNHLVFAAVVAEWCAGTRLGASAVVGLSIIGERLAKLDTAMRPAHLQEWACVFRPPVFVYRHNPSATEMDRCPSAQEASRLAAEARASIAVAAKSTINPSGRRPAAPQQAVAGAGAGAGPVTAAATEKIPAAGVAPWASTAPAVPATAAAGRTEAAPPPLPTEEQPPAPPAPPSGSASTRRGATRSSSKHPAKRARRSRATAGTGATSTSTPAQRKVAPMMEKWASARAEIWSEDSEDSDEHGREGDDGGVGGRRGMYNEAAATAKRARELEDWRVQEIASGSTRSVNFQPLRFDWRERVKRRRQDDEAAALEAGSLCAT